MKDKKVRIQLDFPQEKIDELDALAKSRGIRTRKELFNSALTLFKWAAKETAAGRKIVSRAEAGMDKELAMPALEGGPWSEETG